MGRSCEQKVRSTQIFPVIFCSHDQKQKQVLPEDRTRTVVLQETETADVQVRDTFHLYLYL